MRNRSTVVRGHYDNDRYMWAIIIRRFCDIQVVVIYWNYLMSCKIFELKLAMDDHELTKVHL
jgi:hypothetical protein